jgi:hypothetical protein
MPAAPDAIHRDSRPETLGEYLARIAAAEAEASRHARFLAAEIELFLHP